MTAGLWFSVVQFILKQDHGIFQPFYLESHYLETLKQTDLAIEMSLNKVKTNHRGVKLFEEKGRDTEKRKASVHAQLLRTVFRNNLGLSVSLRLLCQYLLLLLEL